MVKGIRQRTLEKLAYEFWLKNKKRSSAENWMLAEKLLQKLEKRYNIKPREKRKKSK
jgi:hypothetical protein